MGLDFPRAWQIAREAAMEDHDQKCSYRWTDGGLLCDCHVIYRHPEYLEGRLYGKDESDE